MMVEGYSERGFALYASLQDDYGADVQVTESSAAMVEGDDRGPWVWIVVSGGGITDNKGSAHLSPEQARQVRDALDEWLETVD